VLVAALVAAGCGSGPLNANELVTRANAICKEYTQKQNDVEFPSVNPTDPSTSFRDRAMWGAALNQIVQLGRQEVVALRKLRPPNELEARFETFLAAKATAFDGLHAGAEAAKQNHPRAVKTTVDAARKKLARAGRFAKALGLQKCA
jgi:hypothetical protein